MAQRDVESLFRKFREMSGEGIAGVINEAMSNEKWRKGLGRAGERLMANKHTFDRNIESMLDFVNIPSKRDVRELKSRLDHLSSQLLNLSIKLDRLMAPEKEKPVTNAGAEKPVPRLAVSSRRKPR